jgi:hypothetical protein
MINKICSKLKLYINSSKISLFFAFLAIIISLFSLLFTKYSYDDKKSNAELWINIYRFKNLLEYENRIDFAFKTNSINIINVFKREKGLNFINENNDLIEYIFLTKVIYDLTNDSYEQFFLHNNIFDIYNDVGRAINIYDIMYLSDILWNNNDLNDLSYTVLDRIIEKLTSFDKSFKKEKLNMLIGQIRIKKRIESEIIEVNYGKGLKKNNLEKGLIEEYYKMNDYYNGLTLAQSDWFDQFDIEKMSIIESYMSSYFSSILFKYSLEELMNEYKK